MSGRFRGMLRVFGVLCVVRVVVGLLALRRCPLRTFGNGNAATFLVAQFAGRDPVTDGRGQAHADG
ncbi:MAG: hypothetical protein QM770_04270 [Tepidisphaeraceae bacterium]